MKNSRLIVVLGMHRSGTSAITRGLRVLGADFGTNLQAGMLGVNDKGFFEDNDLVSINVDVLSILSHEWHTLSPITRAQLKNESLSGLRLRAIELLREKTQSVNIFAMKDPRVPRLLPFWQDVFDELGVDVSYVIVIRNPLSVAKSLNNRDNFEKEKSCYLWLEHVLPSILGTSGRRRVVVDYDNMIEQPRIELARIAKALKLRGELNPDELIKYENEFLDIDLRHVKSDLNELTLDPAVPQSVVSVYRALVKVAADEWSLDKIEVLNCVREAAAHLNEFAPALSYMTRQDWKIVGLNQTVVERDAQITDLNQAVVERDGQITERDGQIASLNQVVAEREGDIASLQRLSNELRNEIEDYRLSRSWRITKPLREVSQWWQQFIRLVRVFKSYRQIYPGVIGAMRLFYRCLVAIRKGGVKGLRRKVSLHERIINNGSALAKPVTLQCSAHRIDLLHARLEKNLILNPTILFDHNGGGGSNIYTHELVKIIHANGGEVLRVYCYDSIWFVQWIGDGDGIGDEMNFYTSSIEKLFTTLSVSRSTTIVINSLYGYPDVKVAASNIIALARLLNATLEFKIHDFYALCPSPHLSDFEEKYCGVPQDPEVCKLCLKKNHAWYHDWYPIENRPADIALWRKPFAELFEAATTVTFFDRSSVEIVRKAFCLEDSKVKVAPHDINYFKCDNQIDVTGPLHIGILGTLSHIKGGDVVRVLCEHIEEQGLRIPITIVGPSYIDVPTKINVYGDYEQNDLPAIISEKGINVFLMPSIVPETFSYTISEAMEMGLPIVAFDLGAQGNRVKHYKLGKVVPLGSSPIVVLAAIQSALKTAQEFNK